MAGQLLRSWSSSHWARPTLISRANCLFLLCINLKLWGQQKFSAKMETGIFGSILNESRFAPSALKWANTSATAHSRALNKKYLQAAKVLNNQGKKKFWFFNYTPAKEHRNRTIRNDNLKKKSNRMTQIIQYHRNSTWVFWRIILKDEASLLCAKWASFSTGSRK